MLLNGKTSLKKRMDAGEIIFGTFYKFNNPHLVEMLGFAGFDFILLDGEHGTYSYSEMQDMTRFANGVGMSSIIRVPSGLPEHVLHVCDLGAQGVQVPNLKTVDDVKKIVDSMRYYPVGHRGFALTTRAGKYSFCDAQEFMKYSNEEVLCVIMVENLKMVAQIDELCEVPYVDVLFIGPGDLSQEVGKPGQTNCPEVLEIAKKINDVGLAAGKKIGILCNTFDEVRMSLDWGMQYIVYCSELSMIANKFKADIKELRQIKSSATTLVS
jgi:4-hydroxy-2-oxoheptanedioate aldolase